MRFPSAAFAIFVGGVIAGALDIAYALIFYACQGVPPIRILQSIASGLFGSAAFKGGAAMAALGLLLHFVIAWLAAAIFYGASQRLPVLVRRPILSGVLYGLVIYAVMNFIVLPASAFPRKVSFAPLVLTTGILAHMFLIGLPIALTTRRASRATIS